ncbi:(bacterio)chlorophyll synthase [Candidatus Chloroploca asiatica]|uniref:Bacteriochlorophyll/chlorophyll synthetase n=1 Tax=Candidatus Chloroploca asiatica TaxID=1506545 RepID=A0A2H3KTR1_9CHLR|nr:(bacterio)chlorophyll synthase [Candidatus Chloroploca asiatica]PDW01265.1 bacteriochlorophyll/chlorophyll synthetase [Candidatus Chloroploca asiatica]
MLSTSEKQVPLGKKIKAHIDLADPVTWISPSIVTICGALASGPLIGFQWTNPQHWALVMLGALMTGPLGTGFSQSINDYYDRHLDAINDPERPIPAGLVTLNEARLNWMFLATATLLVSFVFQNLWIVLLALGGLVLSVVYSMPPIKLKKHFWLGPPAVGLGYVSMSWLAGHLIFAPLTWESVVVAWINGALAAGLLFLNDIKSVEGDRQHGLQSLAVAIGVHKTLLVAYVTINLSQALLMVLAIVWGYYAIAVFIGLSIVVPIYNQIKLYQDPSQKNYVRYLLASNPFVAIIQFLSGFMVGGYFR